MRRSKRRHGGNRYRWPCGLRATSACVVSAASAQYRKCTAEDAQRQRGRKRHAELSKPGSLEPAVRSAGANERSRINVLVRALSPVAAIG